MTPDEYVKNCVRTESDPKNAMERISKMTDGELKLFKGKLREVIDVLNDLDSYKKWLFYGKPLPARLGTEGRVCAANCESPIVLNEQDTRVMHGAIGICTEGAELLEALMKVIVYGEKLDTTNVIEEYSDTLWYGSIIADTTGVSMETVMDKNIAKLKARYPEKFTEEKAVNRNLETERKILEG